MTYKDAIKNPVFRAIGKLADAAGVRAYVVGGFVRDYFLHRPCKDVDVVVVGSGIELAEALGKSIKTNVTVFKNFGTAMLHYGDLEVEFVGARKESYRSDSRKPIVENGTIEDDQLRRDFTINAMAFSLNADTFGELSDPFNGIGDMERYTLRTPCDPDITFSDDPLRMIRAVRFATQLGFDIAPQTFDAIERNAKRIEIVSVERITTELNKIMAAEVPSIGFKLFDQCGLLPLIFPQVSRLKGVERRGNNAHKDNFLHTLQVLDNVARVSDDLYLRWAALLHDIAKPLTKAYDPVLGWTFHGHEYLGGKMVAQIFKQLRLPTSEKMRYVQTLVQLHLRPIALSQEEITDSAVRRLLFDAGEYVEDLMTLCQADITSTNDVKVQRYLANFEIVKSRMREIEEKDRIRKFQPPISGELIMSVYGIEPCREVGLIKSVIKDAILDGEIENDYQQAYAIMEREAAKYGFKHGDVKSVQ